MAIFSVGMVFIAFQDPYELQELKRNINIATMTMYNVEDYEIDESISSRYKADIAIRFHDRDEFKNFDGFYIKDDVNHTLSSNDAVYKGDLLSFSNNATYLNSDGIKYVSDEIKYNLNTKEIYSDKPFILTQAEDKIIGEEILYKMQTKEIFAKKVKGWSQLDNLKD